jgi:hypothetical protein
VLSALSGRSARGALGIAVLAALLPASVAAAGPYRPPKRAIDLRDQAVARAVVVRKADLPGSGWTAVPLPASDSQLAGIAKSAASSGACKGLDLDASRFTLKGSATSPLFGARGTFIVSSSEVLASRAQAVSYFGGQLDQAALRCSGEIFLDGLKQGVALAGGTATARIVSVRKLQVRSGADQANGLRVVARITSAGRTMTIVADTFALRQQRAIAEMDVGGFGGPPPARVERALLAGVGQRLRAAHT